MPSLSSSMLNSCEYDEASSVLSIMFANGATYAYDAVPESVYAGLVTATSAGRYFIDNIRDQYSTRRV